MNRVSHTSKQRVPQLAGTDFPMEGNLIACNKENPIAVLTAKKGNDPIAVLTFSVGQLSDNETNNRVQLLPDGPFKTSDGRPHDVESGHWLMDEKAFVSLKSSASLRKNDFMFDYEHQTLYTQDNGKKAPASGWFNKLEYVPGQGLFAVDVDWTNTALKLIKEKEYRYVSAVFAYDKTTGRPVSLRHAALTNEPALDGMKAVAALTSNSNHLNTHSNTNQTGEKTMNEAFLTLLVLLGLAKDDEDFSEPAALKAVKEKAVAALKKLLTSDEGLAKLKIDLDAANVSIAALKKDSPTEVNLSEHVPAKLYNDAIVQIAALKAGKENDSVESLLKDNTDKVLESEIEYLTDFGKQQGFAALKTMLEKRPAIAALSKGQTEGKKKPNDGGSHGEGLTDEQIAVCKATGVNQKDFKNQLSNQGEA